MHINIINVDEFAAEFEKFGRGAQFTRGGLAALFEYYEECENSTGECIKLDVIAVCCEWVELFSLKEILQDYSNVIGKDIESATDAVNKLREHTHVIELDDSFLVENF